VWGCLQFQVFFCKRATNYRALLRKMTYKDKASYGSSPPCMYITWYTIYIYSGLPPRRLQVQCTIICVIRKWSIIYVIRRGDIWGDMTETVQGAVHHHVCNSKKESKWTYVFFYSYTRHVHSYMQFDRKKPPPPGGFLFTVFPDQEPGGRGTPLKNHPQN